MSNPTPLTPNELKALAYFAVGVTSEGSVGGRDVSYRLSFAGNVGRDGLMHPIGNSGYSFGTLQVDIGQHPDVAPRLLDAYQAWARKQPHGSTPELSVGEYRAILAAIQRDGHAMKDAGARDIDRSRINRFLASSDGRAFVHGLDIRHIDGVTAVDTDMRNGDSALEQLERTALYRNAGDDEQARIAALFMKLQNQSNQRYAPGLLRRIEAGELASATDVKTAINALMRNPAKGGGGLHRIGREQYAARRRAVQRAAGCIDSKPCSPGVGRRRRGSTGRAGRSVYGCSAARTRSAVRHDPPAAGLTGNVRRTQCRRGTTQRSRIHALKSNPPPRTRRR